MKQKLLTIAVVSALGMTGLAQAQAPDGIRAYFRANFTDLVVTTQEGAPVVPGPGFGGGVQGSGGTTAGIAGPLPLTPADPGIFNTDACALDAEQACINEVGANDPAAPCPAENTFQPPIGPYEDFGRGDQQVISAFPFTVPGGCPAPLPPILPGDGTSGDDVLTVAECQRSLEGTESRISNGNVTMDFISDLFTVPADTDSLVIMFQEDVFAEAEVSPALAGTLSQASASNSIQVSVAEFDADGQDTGRQIPCDTAAVEDDVVATGDDLTPPPFDPVVATASCSDGAPITSDFQYRQIFNVSIDTNCRMVPPGFQGDHWLCYKAFDDTLREPVNLLDQFENKNYEVVKPQFMCNPADKKVGDGPTELIPAGGENDHVTGYQLAVEFDDLYIRHQRQTVLVTDQFGPKTVTTVRDADRLWVPSGKSLVPGAAPIPNIDHYKCYDVQVDGFQPITVGLGDQFSPTNPGPDGVPGTEDDILNQWQVARPTQLCTPAQKTLPDGSVTPIADPEQHLMCYDVRRAGRQTLFGPQTVYMTNQFVAADDLLVKHEAELCVTAFKELLP